MTISIGSGTSMEERLRWGTESASIAGQFQSDRGNTKQVQRDKNVYKQESHLIPDAIFSRSTLQDLLQVWKEKN